MADKRYDLDELEHKLAAKLTATTLVGEGSVLDARQVLEVLDRIRSQQAAGEHRRCMEKLAGDPVELARYLGYLGETRRKVERAGVADGLAKGLWEAARQGAVGEWSRGFLREGQSRRPSSRSADRC